MTIAIIGVFSVGYILIALERLHRIDKSAVALLTGVACWTILMVSGIPPHADEALAESLTGTASILFFLMGAMTIVEIVDAHEGFDVITRRIGAMSPRRLLWVIGTIAFFLSAALDNLTTTIVMISLARKLVHDRQTRLYFAGAIVIAANAGGAWSPIGDVTTTMLWIEERISTLGIVGGTFLPSLASFALPMAAFTFALPKATAAPPARASAASHGGPSSFEKSLVFILGIGGLLFVPVFKTLTHLPPYMGMLLALGVIWGVTDLLHRGKTEETRRRHGIASALQRIDMGAVLFFLGILLAVATLEASGVLGALAGAMDRAFSGSFLAIAGLIGLASAVVDNVPLVAASIGMYGLDRFATDAPFWHALAYTAGTGGSILIIGSAAGVAAMGMEKIEFGWYALKIGLWALLGYAAGIGVFMVLGG